MLRVVGEVLKLLSRLWDFFALRRQRQLEEEIQDEYQRLEDDPHTWMRDEFGRPPGVRRPPGNTESGSGGSRPPTKTDS